MRAVWLLPMAVLLSGCASFSPDGSFGQVAEAVRTRTGQEAKWLCSADESNSVRARVA